MYPQGNSPDHWPQYDQQPYQHDPYGQPQSSPPYQPSSPPYQPSSPPYQPLPPAYQPSPPPYQAAYQQPTGFPGQPFPGPVNPRPSGGKTALIVVGAVVGALVLLCGVGVLVVALSPSPNDAGSNVAGSATASASSSATADATPTPTTTPTTEPSTDDLAGDIDRFKEGDCLTITGADNEVKPAKCTDAGAYKVLLRREGVDATTRQSVCDAVGDDFTDILYVDALGTSDDLILCVGPAK